MNNPKHRNRLALWLGGAGVLTVVAFVALVVFALVAARDRLDKEPNTAAVTIGGWTVQARLTQALTYEVSATAVSADVTALPQLSLQMSGMMPQALILRRADGGRFVATGTLAMDGAWEVAVDADGQKKTFPLPTQVSQQ